MGIIHLSKGIIWRKILVLSRYKFNLFFTIANILLNLILFTIMMRLIDPEVFRQYSGVTNLVSYIFVGILATNFQVLGISNLPYQVSRELQTKQMEFVLSGPISFYQYLFASGIGSLVVENTVILPVYILIFIYFNISVTLETLTIAIIICMVLALTFIQVGMVISSFVLEFRDVGSFLGFIASLLSFIAGTYFPLLLLPVPLIIIAFAIPTTVGIDLLRHYLLNGITLLSPEAEWVILMFHMAFYTLLAKFMVRRALRKIKDEGISYI